MEPTLTDQDLIAIKDKAIEYWAKHKYNPYSKDERMDMTLCYVHAMADVLKEKHFLTINIWSEYGINK